MQTQFTGSLEKKTCKDRNTALKTVNLKIQNYNRFFILKNLSNVQIVINNNYSKIKKNRDYKDFDR